MPELEFRQSSDERSEFFILLGRKSSYGAIFHLIVDDLVGGVKFGLEEGKEKVEEIDA